MKKNLNLDKAFELAKERITKTTGENNVKSAIMLFSSDEDVCTTTCGTPKDILKLVLAIKEENIIEQIAKKSLELRVEEMEDMPAELKESFKEMIKNTFKDIHAEAKHFETGDFDSDNDTDTNEVA